MSDSGRLICPRSWLGPLLAVLAIFWGTIFEWLLQPFLQYSWYVEFQVCHLQESFVWTIPLLLIAFPLNSSQLASTFFVWPLVAWPSIFLSIEWYPGDLKKVLWPSPSSPSSFEPALFQCQFLLRQRPTIQMNQTNCLHPCCSHRLQDLSNTFHCV